jgi:hypothetical protein
MNLAYSAATTDRRLGLLLTVAVHLALVIAWQAARTPPAPASADDGKRSRIMWIPLPAPLPLPRPAPRDKEPAAPQREAVAPRPQQYPGPTPAVPQPIQVVPATPATPSADTAATPTPAASAGAPAQAAPAAAPSAKDILDRAKRDIGGIDKALRKENKPYIAAPLDSPQIRMRRGMEQAAAMAPNRLWEAPKVEALVNDTGDGARRSRIITGNGTYCITDRAPTTSIDMIEKHGKQRITSCPQHELPASQQEWRTLRD